MLDYDVGLSFAGEDRKYVEAVAENLRARAVRVFYDRYEQVDLWGKNLYDHLNEIYNCKCEYVVMFISKFYAEKVWTNHERKSAQARAFREKREYILPVRFDDTQIPGVLSTIGYLDGSITSTSDLGEMIEKKIGKINWLRQARSAARFTSRHKMSAHIGVLLWISGVCAVFFNRGWKNDDPFIERVRKCSTIEKILAEENDSDGCILVILVKGARPIAIFEEAWTIYEKSIGHLPGSSVFVQVQKEIAFQELYSHFEKPVLELP